MSKPTTIALSQIIADQENVMGRQSIDESTVFAYKETYLEQPNVMPPLIVFHDGQSYHLADGFHRFEALKLLEAKTVEVIIKKGSKRDAILFAVGANANHGLRRTNGDKRACTERLMDDPEWSQWVNTEIAKAAGVSESFVRKILDERKEKELAKVKEKTNAMKKLGIAPEIVEQYATTVSGPALKKFYHPKTGKPTYRPANNPKAPKVEDGAGESFTISKKHLEHVLDSALGELDNVEETNEKLDQFINKIKANLSQVAKGRNPIKVEIEVGDDLEMTDSIAN